MKENELKGIIIDLWRCTDQEKFKNNLKNKGLSEQEIKNYIKQINKICLI